MEEIKLSNDDSIFTALLKLIEANVAGKHVYCDFHGVKFYSDSYGCLNALLEEKKIKKEEKTKQKKMEEDRKHALVIENISNIIERGKELIYPFRHEEWAKLVEADAFGDYSGMITKHAIEIMAAIEEGKNVEELVEMFKQQCDSGWSSSLTRNIVMIYSRNGYPFYKAVRDGELTEEECKAILRIIHDNEEYSKDLHFANSVAESKNEVSIIQKRLIRNKSKGQL